MKNFLKSDRGAIGIFVAFAIIPLLVIVGIAVDGSRGYLLKSRLQSASDGAALAATKSIKRKQSSADAWRFMEANFPKDYMNARLDKKDVKVVVDKKAGRLTVKAGLKLRTQFMKLLGLPEMKINATSVVGFNIRKVEMAMVLDVSGSMGSSGRMDALKTASHELIDILAEADVDNDHVFMSVVPYNHSINVGPIHTNFLIHGGADLPMQFNPESWLGCIEMRDPPNWRSEVPPRVIPFGPHLADTSGGGSPNADCDTPPITPLTSDKERVKSVIDSLSPRGNTIINAGMVWGWRTISQGWRGAWQGDTPSNRPVRYRDWETDKVLVLMTDGRNDVPSGNMQTTFGLLSEGKIGGYTDDLLAEDHLNNKLPGDCRKIRAKGVIIYTIMFQQDDPETVSMFQECASSADHYFNADSRDQLIDSFREIAETLSEVRLIQ